LGETTARESNVAGTDSNLRRVLRGELEIDRSERGFGTGWISGTLAVVTAVASLALALCRYAPDLLIAPQLRGAVTSGAFSVALIMLVVLSFALALLNLLLRPNPVLGFCAVMLVIVANFVAGLPPIGAPHTQLYFGLDFFVLNILLNGVLFIPLQKLFPHKKEQVVLREEWKEDLFYHFISSLLVQVITYFTLLPSHTIQPITSGTSLSQWVGGQPLLLQILAIMVLTDFLQYWVHRLFHQIPFLWRFHAVHHSAKSMDWLAGARMHFVEIVALRAVTAIPMFTLGFTTTAIQAYLVVVYFYSAFIHANIGWNLSSVEKLLVTPRFHHWHHGVEREAIDVNFSIHFPIFDRLFGTHHMPENRWPEGYGIGGHPVPRGYLAQMLYPFRKDRPSDEAPASVKE
jgi:sterol desaturase/sphingolipid hydroxylase (fatty acid hydroxylase superfamily)